MKAESAGHRPPARVRLVDADGSSEDVTDQVPGLEGFYDAWEPNAPAPQPQMFSAWQQVDDDHPIGRGRSGYRIAWKTLRTAVLPPVVIKHVNVRVRFDSGAIERGGARVENTIRARKDGVHLIPEFGRVVGDGVQAPATYLHCPDLGVNISGWEETLPAVCFVEIIWTADREVTEYSELLELGRSAVAPLLALIEFEFGERLIYTQLLEEVGEVHADWHWSRRVELGPIYAESQARFEHQPGAGLASRLKPLMEDYLEASERRRAQLRIASRWYWRAQRETDPVLSFVNWWLVTECLEMPQATNIDPVKRVVSALLELPIATVAPMVGRLFGLRSKLVHGEVEVVPVESLSQVEALARLLLSYRTGTLKESGRRQAAIALLGEPVIG